MDNRTLILIEKHLSSIARSLKELVELEKGKRDKEASNANQVLLEARGILEKRGFKLDENKS